MSIAQKVAVGAVVVAAVWGGATLYIGTQAEKQYNAIVDKIEKDFPALTIKERQFERSFLSSHAKLTLQADFSEIFDTPADNNETLTLETQILHGPLTKEGFYLATFRTQPVLGAEQRAKLRPAFGEQDPFSASGQWNLSGVVHGHFALAPFTVGETGDGIQAGSLTIDFAAQNDKVLWHTGSLPSLKIHSAVSEQSLDSPAFQAEFGPISWHADNHYNGATVGDLAPSEVQIQLGKFTMRRVDDDAAVEMGKIAAQAALTLKEDFADIQETITFDAIAFRPEATSEARTLGTLTFQLDLKHLAAEPLDEMIKNIDRLNTASMDDKQKMELLLATSAPHLIEIFTADPRFSFDPMRLSTPKGDITLSASLAAPGLAQQDLLNPMGAFDKLQLKIEATAPKAALVHANTVLANQSEEEAAREVEEWLAEAREEKMFTVEGDTLRFAFRIQQGAITLNGQSFSMAELIAKTQGAQSALENAQNDADEEAADDGFTPTTPPPGMEAPSPAEQ